MALAKCSRCGTSVQVTPVGTESPVYCPTCRKNRVLYRCFSCMKHTLLASGTRACPHCNTLVRSGEPIVPPPQEELATRRALNDLKTKPLVFLGNTKVMIGGFRGTDSASARMSVSLTGNVLWIGPRDFVEQYIGPQGGSRNSVITCQMIYTPTRSNDVTVARTAATQRLLPGTNELWVTTRQTGCTVLILDWGALGYSMVHLQPHKTEDFNWFVRHLFAQSRPLTATTKNYYLRQEATAVANATGGGAAPRRYLLVQSGHTSNAVGTLQIIGVRNGPGWDFYSQIDQHGVYTAQMLQWQDWSKWWPYVAAHS